MQEYQLIIKLNSGLVKIDGVDKRENKWLKYNTPGAKNEKVKLIFNPDI